MSIDNYEYLLKEGFLEKKKKRNKKDNKKKILNKVLYRNYEIEENEKFLSSNSINKEIKNTKISNYVLGTNNIFEHVTNLKCKYQDELNGFDYIDSNNISKIKEGSFIRLIDLKENLKWGGMIIKLINKNNLSKFQIQLKNKNNNLWKVKFIKYFVFYKQNIPNGKFRDLFISLAKLDT